MIIGEQLLLIGKTKDFFKNSKYPSTVSKFVHSWLNMFIVFVFISMTRIHFFLKWLLSLRYIIIYFNEQSHGNPNNTSKE